MLQITRIDLRGSMGNALLEVELHLTDSCVTDENVRLAVPRVLDALIREVTYDAVNFHMTFCFERVDPSTVLLYLTP